MFYDGRLIDDYYGPYNLTRTLCGGEASSAQHALGIAGCLNTMKARCVINTVGRSCWEWYGFHYRQVDPGYAVGDSNAENWQFRGNN
jgi:hypothetical protein